MHRVLSFQMGNNISGRGFGESSEFVTKRMCFSFIFFFGFLALIGGFLLGRMATEKTLKLCEDRNTKCVESTNGVLGATGPAQLLLQYDLLLAELQNSSFDQSHFTKKSEKYRNEDDHTERETVETILSNSGLFYRVVQRKSSLVATLIGSLERDRWVVFSVSGSDGTSLALELMSIFGKLSIDHKWKPQRTIIFCFSDEPHDSCRDILPKYSKSRIAAYLAVHGDAVQKKGCLRVSGSDVIKSVVLGTVQESISASSSGDRRVFDSCNIENDAESWIFIPRLVTDVPHAYVAIKTSNGTKTEFSNETELLPYRRILARIIGISIWKLSDSAVLHWDPKDFEQSVRTALKLLNSSRFSEVEDKITSTTQELINRVQSSSISLSNTQISSSLSSRMTNDLLMDLDRALLCPDIDSRSKTDLSMVPELSSKSQEAISLFLENLLRCYNDAVEVIQEG